MKYSLAKFIGTHKEKHVIRVWNEFKTGFVMLGSVAVTALYGNPLISEFTVSLVMDERIWESLSANDRPVSPIDCSTSHPLCCWILFKNVALGGVERISGYY